MKSAISWNVALPSLVEIHRRFGGTYCIDLHVTSVSKAINEQAANSKFLASLPYKMKKYVPETPMNFYRTALSHVCCEHPRSNCGLLIYTDYEHWRQQFISREQRYSHNIA
jgi:hypothetical protein